LADVFPPQQKSLVERESVRSLVN